MPLLCSVKLIIQVELCKHAVLCELAMRSSALIQGVVGGCFEKCMLRAKLQKVHIMPRKREDTVLQNMHEKIKRATFRKYFPTLGPPCRKQLVKAATDF